MEDIYICIFCAKVSFKMLNANYNILKYIEYGYFTTVHSQHIDGYILLSALQIILMGLVIQICKANMIHLVYFFVF